MASTLKNRQQFLVKLGYIGSLFHGVQEQPNVITVLGALRNLVEAAARQRAMALVASARTDRGVHALENFVTFYLKEPIDVKKFISDLREINTIGLFILSICQVSLHVHARGNSRGKTYRYTIVDGCKPDELGDHPLSWAIVPRLSEEKMRKASLAMIGEMDFSSLQGGGCQAGSTIKQIFLIDVIRNFNGAIFIEVFGNAFLRKMIRNMVGLLVEIGAGLREPACVKDILAKKSRTASGIMAPAHGLCLIKVGFEI
jgi:tRNA pseudouridine38-40 synthase